MDLRDMLRQDCNRKDVDLRSLRSDFIGTLPSLSTSSSQVAPVYCRSSDFCTAHSSCMTNARARRHADLENAERQRTAAWAAERGSLAEQAKTVTRERDSLAAEAQRLSV